MPSHLPVGWPRCWTDYLVRYSHRVAISNERTISDEHDQLQIRMGDKRPGHKHTVTLPVNELIGRFMFHVLSAGFKRIRHYSLLATTLKRERPSAARAALNIKPPRLKPHTRSSPASQATIRAAAPTPPKGTGAPRPYCPRHPAANDGPPLHLPPTHLNMSVRHQRARRTSHAPASRTTPRTPPFPPHAPRTTRGILPLSRLTAVVSSSTPGRSST